MFRFYFIIFIIFYCKFLFAKNLINTISLTVFISGESQEKLYLKSFYGIKTTLIDSAARKSDKFQFFNNNLLRGYYRVFLNDTNYADIILSPNEQVELKLDGNNLKTGLSVINSLENSLLFEFKRNKISLDKQVKRILIETSYLAKESKRYLSLMRTKDSLNTAFDLFAENIILKNPNTYFALTTNGVFSVKPETHKDFASKYNKDERAFMREHFFDRIDFNNEDLIRTTLLPNRYMKYFETYVDYDEKGFKEAIDIILSKASANQQVYNLTLDFLMELFDKAGPEIIFEYITEKYFLQNSCGEQTDTKFLQKTLRYKSLMIGETVPDISISDSLGRIIDLKNIYSSHKITLLFFWSSHCNFCMEEVPLIKKLYVKYRKKGFSVYAVSIDEYREEWKAFIKKEKLTWINAWERGSWKASSAEKFMVNRTPTTYLIDNKGKILAKNIKGNNLEEMVKLFFK